ncbi:ASCH domain-containing protein [Jannaschia sp. 2305UL9-9]|uniref:ASCH domain-containing protein n=1 Tax=Jannaschia sp. 2305UL9-9 TaxID=3121638 RepID=UPI003528C9DF
MQTLQQIIDANPEAETFRFGETQQMSDRILSLVRSGRKTATCEAARHYGPKGDAWPEVGRRDVALEWDGRPAVMIETVAVETRRWSEMDEAFVALQGEFESLDAWRRVYRPYFERSGGWSEDMKIMCESFRVVEDYAEAIR